MITKILILFVYSFIHYLKCDLLIGKFSDQMIQLYKGITLYKIRDVYFPKYHDKLHSSINIKSSSNNNAQMNI